MSLETALNEAIESAEEILNFLMEEIENYGRPHHPSPSRKSLRESANFIQRVFNQEPTLPNVFMVLFRMSRRLYDRLLSFIEADLTVQSLRNVSPRDKLAIYLLFVGSDGKYIYIRKPDNAGSQWYCHKMRHAMVLMALVDSKYRFLRAQVGSYGSNNDAYIFNNSDFCQKAEKGYLNLPEDRRLHDSNKMLPYFFVGDDAFALRPWLMKPLKHGDMFTKEDAEANYRISLARRCVEQAFGGLSKKFRFFQRDVQMGHENVVEITHSILCVYNLLKNESQPEETDLFERSVSSEEQFELPDAEIRDQLNLMGPDPELIRRRLFEYLTNEGRILEQIGKTGNIS